MDWPNEPVPVILIVFAEYIHKFAQSVLMNFDRLQL